MFTLATLLVMALAAADAVAALVRYGVLFEQLVPLLREDPASARVFFFGRLLDGAAQVWLLLLTLPLKELSPDFALGWACLVVVGACDSVWSARTIQEAVAAPGPPPRLAIHRSWPYRIWRCCHDAVIVVGCGMLLASGG